MENRPSQSAPIIQPVEKTNARRKFVGRYAGSKCAKLLHSQNNCRATSLPAGRGHANSKPLDPTWLAIQNGIVMQATSVRNKAVSNICCMTLIKQQILIYPQS
jgi:hypothetical protein